MKTRGILYLFVLVSVFVCMGSHTFGAVETSYTLEFYNRYIWRGFDLNPDNKFVVQPSVDFTFGDSPWSANLWYNYSNENHELNEIDLTISYLLSSNENFDITIGSVLFGWYWAKDFNTENNTTIENFVTLAWKNHELNPELSIYHDCKNGNGLYASLALSKEIKLSEKQNLEISSSIGYNQKQWISRSGFSDVNLKLAIPLNEGKITPFFGITWPLLDDINPDVAREYWMGISLSF